MQNSSVVILEEWELKTMVCFFIMHSGNFYHKHALTHYICNQKRTNIIKIFWTPEKQTALKMTSS